MDLGAVHPEQSLGICGRVGVSGHRVDSLDLDVEALDPLSRLVRRGRIPEDDDVDVLGRPLQPLQRMGQVVGVLVHPGHRVGMKGLDDQGSDPAAEQARAAVNLPRDGIGAEEAPVPWACRGDRAHPRQITARRGRARRS